jgi:arsenic resistance protein ArsH
MEQFPALNTECFDQHIAERLHLQEPPRILILYGSVKSAPTAALPRKKLVAC